MHWNAQRGPACAHARTDAHRAQRFQFQASHRRVLVGSPIARRWPARGDKNLRVRPQGQSRGSGQRAREAHTSAPTRSIQFGRAHTGHTITTRALGTCSEHARSTRTLWARTHAGGPHPACQSRRSRPESSAPDVRAPIVCARARSACPHIAPRVRARHSCLLVVWGRPTTWRLFRLARGAARR